MTRIPQLGNGKPWLTVDQLEKRLKWSHGRVRYYIDVFRPMLEGYSLLRRATRGRNGTLLVHPVVARIFPRVKSDSERLQLSIKVAFAQMFGGKAFDILEEELEALEHALSRERNAQLQMDPEPAQPGESSEAAKKPGRRLIRKLADVLGSQQ